MPSFSRYRFSNIIGGKYYGTSYVTQKINRAIESNAISYTTITLGEGQRLDHIAGITYKNSEYWWIIAAASGIGWGLQVTPGTIIKIPNSIEEILSIL